MSTIQYARFASLMFGLKFLQSILLFYVIFVSHRNLPDSLSKINFTIELKILKYEIIGEITSKKNLNLSPLMHSF